MSSAREIHGSTPLAFALAGMMALLIECAYRLTKREIRLRE